MTEYQAIVFDLDGTAIASRADAMPSKSLVQTISEAQKHLSVSVATGRSWEHAHRPIRAMGLDGPCVISGGTQIIYPRSKTIAWERTFTRDDVDIIIDFARRHKKLVAYVSKLTVSQPNIPGAETFAQAINTIYMLGIKPDEISLLKIFDSSGIIVSLTKSWTSPDVVDLHITPSNATKEHAIHELCKLLNVDSELVIGVGDGHNDIHLFNAVGFKVAMGNAEPELSRIADKVIDSVENDGLAKYMISLVEDRSV